MAAVQSEDRRVPVASVLTRVLIVDDHRTFADLLAFSLDAEDDFQCVGRASTVADAMRLTDELLPDVVMMDIGLPDGNGIAATAEILRRHPEVRVLILTAFVDQTMFARAAQAGASAFLVKDGGLDEVLSALRGARAGTVIINSELLSSLAVPAPSSRAAEPMARTLTARELDVLRLLAEGEDVRRIAKALGITVSTCRSQVKSLREKLGAHTQLEAVVKATRAGLLEETLPTSPVPAPKIPPHVAEASAALRAH